MRLSIDQRSRIVAIYFEHGLHFMKKKYEKYKIAAEIGINISERKVRKFVERFLITGNLNEKIINDEVIILMIILSRKTK
jgi:hypothetical protein